jgi:DNA invertase Pin-like site-specific DNA recombinase
MVIGYLRVSTGKQYPANQRDEIQRFAARKNFNIDAWVTEVASGGKSEKERKLGQLLSRMKRGDTLIVTEISRLSRTLTDIMSIMGKCLKKEINLYTTKEGYTFDNSINSKVLCFAFGLVAEIERNLISMRTKEALALRRSAGIVLGRRKGSYTKSQLLIENRQQIIRMLNDDCSVAGICKHYSLSRETFTRFRKKYPSVERAFREKEKRRISRIGNHENRL